MGTPLLKILTTARLVPHVVDETHRFFVKFSTIGSLLAILPFVYVVSLLMKATGTEKTSVCRRFQRYRF
jgi:hypothetical protein